VSRSKTTVIALATTLTLPIGLAVAQKPPKGGNGQLTLTATPQPIVFGGSTTLAGKLTGGQAAGQPVVVEANPAPFAGFKPVATVTTGTGGTYSAVVKPGSTTRYRVTARTSPPTVSGEVAVGVRIRVGIVLSTATPRAGRSVTFSGQAFPAHDGALVSIRKRSPSGAFVTIARTRLQDDGTSRSRYRRAVRIPRSGVFQVRVSSGDGDHLAGLSRLRRITVR
jgi:hypothetical protein